MNVILNHIISWLLGWPRRRTDCSPWIHADLQDSLQRRHWDHQQICLHQESVRSPTHGRMLTWTFIYEHLSFCDYYLGGTCCSTSLVLCSLVFFFCPLKRPNSVGCADEAGSGSAFRFMSSMAFRLFKTQLRTDSTDMLKTGWSGRYSFRTTDQSRTATFVSFSVNWTKVYFKF